MTNHTQAASHPILVTGATGAVGRQLVTQLLARGALVRALSRTPDKAHLPAEVAVFRGDVASNDVDEAALVGVRQVFVFAAEPGVAGFAERLGAAKVEHAVVLSSLAAALEHARDQGSASALHHLSVERDVVRGGVPVVTTLRPGTFANNLRAWAHSIRSGAPIELAYPTSAQAPIHEADVAAVAAAVLLDPTHRGRCLPLTGPQALTRIEQLETIARAIGRALSHREVSAAHFASTMGRFMPPAIIKLLTDYWSDTVEKPDTVRSGVLDVTGQPARTLADWARDHARDFT